MEASAANEQALLEVRVTPDRESYRAYYWFAMVRHPLFWFLLLFLLSLLLLIIPLFFVAHRLSLSLSAVERTPLYFLMDLRSLTRFGAVLAGLPVLLVPGIHLIYRRLAKQYTEGDLFYVFYPDEFQVTHIDRPAAEIETVRYNAIKTVYEVEDAFYLQPIDKDRAAHVLSKQFFTPEQMEALRELFAKKFGKSQRA